ncbi:MAG: hypothetical protein ACREL7_01130 [Longimicrobiales bacterium]
MRSTGRLLVLLCAVAQAACSDSLAPDAAFETDDAAAVAIDTDALVADIILTQIGLFVIGAGAEPSVNSSDERSFSRTRDCPAGGSVSLNGTAERTISASGVAEFTVTATGEWIECARSRGERKLTIDGSFSVEAHRSRLNGEFVGIQTTTKNGEFTWTRSNGESGSCAFSVTTTRNPETHSRHVEGTICGRSFERDVTWSRGEG